MKTKKMRKEKDGGDHLGGRAARIGGSSSNAWDGIVTSFFRGTVYHVRHKPAVHAFRYPLYFAVVDLDEATLLFGRDRVATAAATYHPTNDPANGIVRPRSSDRRGLLWPLNTLMLLRDSDHLKNGEGLTTTTSTTTTTSSCPPSDEVRLSMRERIMNLLHERTCGKLNLLQPKESVGGRRRIVLVTHLMYYGYCFNPVSFFFVMKPTSSTNDNDDDDDDDKKNNKEEEEDELEAIVVEVSNTPWNEMYVYVLHPDSIDIIDYSTTATTTITTKQKQHRYRWRKAFHVSPFMTMDYIYDWKFVITGKDCISVEAKMIRQCPTTTNHDDTLSSSAAAAAAAAATISDKGVINKEDNDKDDNECNSRLYFTAGFTIHRTTPITTTSSTTSLYYNNYYYYYYPIQLALIIIRYPMYCMLIQLWIHYEAVQLLLRKNVQFIPHPLGSTTFVSTMIEFCMIPIYAIIKCFDKNLINSFWTTKKKK